MKKYYWYSSREGYFMTKTPFVENEPGLRTATMAEYLESISPYYAIFDQQTGNYLHTGYNERSLKGIAEAYVSYKSIDTDEKELQKRIDKFGIELVLAADEFELEQSEEPFEELT